MNPVLRLAFSAVEEDRRAAEAEPAKLRQDSFLECPPALGPELAGAELAMDEVYRRYAPLVWRWAQALGSSSVDAQDVVQEVFLVAQNRLSSFARGTSLAGWLFGITRRVSDHQRRRQRRRDSIDEQQPTAEPDPVRDPEQRLAQRQELELVMRALETLPELERTVFILFELEGVGGRELAELLGLKSHRMWATLNRARTKFKRRVRELGIGPTEVEAGTA